MLTDCGKAKSRQGAQDELRACQGLKRHVPRIAEQSLPCVERTGGIWPLSGWTLTNTTSSPQQNAQVTQITLFCVVPVRSCFVCKVSDAGSNQRGPTVESQPAKAAALPSSLQGRVGGRGREVIMVEPTKCDESSIGLRRRIGAAPLPSFC